MQTNLISCVLCNNKRTKANERRTVSKDSRKILNRCFLLESTGGKVICNKCRHKELLEQLREEANMKRKTRLDFDDPESMTDDDYVTLTGLRKSDFDDITDICQLRRC